MHEKLGNQNFPDVIKGLLLYFLGRHYTQNIENMHHPSILFLFLFSSVQEGKDPPPNKPQRYVRPMGIRRAHRQGYHMVVRRR